MSENALTIMSRATELLAQADTIQKTKELKTLALTAADYAKRKGLGDEAIKHARNFAMDAARKMGQMLLATKRAKGVRLKGKDIGGPVAVPPNKQVPTLKDLGISKNESSEAQKLAKLPEPVYEQVKKEKLQVWSRPKSQHKPQRKHVSAWSIDDDRTAISTLFDRLKPNWKTEIDKKKMRTFLLSLAEEI